MKLFSRIREIGFQAAWLKLKNMLFPKDSQVIMACSTNGAYEYLRRYRYVLQKQEDWHDTSEREKVIWTCWLQGEQEAPPIVKRCIASIRQYAGEYKVVVIDEYNLHEWVTFPDYIETKYKRGIISRTHYSDLLRLELLDKYGGIWIDSTFLLTGALPQYITQSPFFCYQCRPIGHIRMGNPLLASNKGHLLVRDMKNLLLEYWLKENRLVSYTIFHLFFTLCYEESERDRKLIRQIPYVPTELRDIMLYHLADPYSPALWQHITSLSPLHKLTYRFDRYGVEVEKKGTLYQYIVSGM